MATDWFGVDMAPLPGGYSGETFVVGTGDDAVVLRIYRREPERALIDASLLRLMRGLLDVPEVIDVRPATADSPAILVTERMYGVPLDGLLRKPPRGLAWETLGLELGWILGALSRIPFLESGLFTDARLTVSSGGLPHDLAEWADLHRRTSRLASWPERDWQALKDLVDQAQAMLDEDSQRGPARTVLVHGDFNPKNILADPQDAALTALLDWEYAHAGSSIHRLRQPHPLRARRTTCCAPMIEGFGRLRAGATSGPFVTRVGPSTSGRSIELAGRTPPNPVCELAKPAAARAGPRPDLAGWPGRVRDEPRRVDPVGLRETRILTDAL